MRLRTRQGTGFSLTSGTVDPTRSTYRDLPKFPEAYVKLAALLGTEQIIWCSVHPEKYTPLPLVNQFEWVLEVPEAGFFKIIDNYVWNRIVGRRVFPESLRQRALREAPTRSVEREAFKQRAEDAYHAQPEPEGGWWSLLFITDVSPEGAVVLLELPIPQQWVVVGPPTL